MRDLYETIPAGVSQFVPASRLPRIPDYDPHGRGHLWITLALHRISDPAALRSGEQSVHLDAENLLSVEGPGCYYCEAEYRPGMERRPCPGEPRC